MSNNESILNTNQLMIDNYISYSKLVQKYEMFLEKAKGSAEVAGDAFFKEIRHKRADDLKNFVFRVQLDVIDVYYMMICGVSYENSETIKDVVDECKALKKNKFFKYMTKEDRNLMQKHIKYIFSKWHVKL